MLGSALYRVATASRRRVRARERDRDTQATAGVRCNLEVRVVGGGDRGHDRQPQPVSEGIGRSIGGEAPEGLEQSPDLIGRHLGARVDDDERRMACIGLQRHPDPAFQQAQKDCGAG